MICRACGTDNRAGAKFCVECGAGLGAACPSCGSAVEANAKFCPECGTRLTAADGAAPTTPHAQPSQAATATERRVVSVVFADLVGFTSVAEARDAEAVRDLLGRYFERASEIVARYGGTVEKFIGDAVMAVWGTPIAHEDDAERSVRAALDLVDAVRALGREAGVPDLQARAGVLTGEAAVAIGAHNQGMVAGDLVNTASRLQSAAEPGTVLVGDATRRAAEGAIAFEAIGGQALKGKTTPVPAHRAMRVVATVGGALRTEALEPPFVGRETEFRLLRDLFHATGRDRRARLVSLTGQAGIGKSRLAWEFEKYLDGITEPVWWHRGRSLAYGEGVTFWALGEMVRKRAGLAEADDDATSRERLTAVIEEHVEDPVERAFVEPALLALLGLAEPPAGGRDRLFAGWRVFLEHLSETATVALVFEDLQWADDGLLDFLDHLLEWSRSYPIYVVTLARPELLDRRPNWGAGGRSASSLALGPLAEPDMRALLAGLVPGLGEAAVRAILGRADGIPLYAVETVRMLVADGRLEPADNGTFRPTRRLSELEVPATLQALIAARLDGLDAAERSLLQDASVLGKTFTTEALAAVTGTSAEEIADRLRRLVGQEILELDTDPASPERGQYGFVQALIREVAYSTLARRNRRQRHLAAARYFESRGDDELAPVLASHYLDAYRAAPDGPEGEAVRAQARIALRASADRASALGSYGAVVTALEQSLELGAADPADEADARQRAGVAADLHGDYARARGHLTRALELRRAGGDQRRTGEVAAALALTLSNAGHEEQALAMLEEVAKELTGPDADVARAPITARVAQVHVRAGRARLVLDIVDEVLQVAEEHRLEVLFLDALISKGSAMAVMGRSMEGAVLVDGAQRIATERGFVSEQMRAMTNAVVVRLDVEPARAFELGVESIAQARRFGVQTAVTFLAVNTCEIGVHTGDWDRAEAIIDSLLATEMDPVDRLAVLAQAAMLAIYRGRRDDERLVEFQDQAAITESGVVGILGRDVAMVSALMDGDYPAAYRQGLEQGRIDEQNANFFFERAARAALWMDSLDQARVVQAEFEGRRHGGAYPVALLTAVRAAVLALEGRREEAVTRYQDAFRQLDALGLRLDAALARLDAARALGVAIPEIGRALSAARATFERLGAAALVERADLVAGDPTGAPSSDASRRLSERPEATRA